MLIITIGDCKVIWLEIIDVSKLPDIKKLVKGSKINQFSTKKTIANNVNGIKTQLIHIICKTKVHCAIKTAIAIFN